MPFVPLASTLRPMLLTDEQRDDDNQNHDDHSQHTKVIMICGVLLFAFVTGIDGAICHLVRRDLLVGDYIAPCRVLQHFEQTNKEGI